MNTKEIYAPSVDHDFKSITERMDITFDTSLPAQNNPGEKLPTPLEGKIALGRAAVNQMNTHNKVWRFIDKIGINSEEQRAKDGALINYLGTKDNMLGNIVRSSREKRKSRRSSRYTTPAKPQRLANFSEDKIRPVAINKVASNSKQQAKKSIDLPTATRLSETAIVSRPNKISKKAEAYSNYADPLLNRDINAEWNAILSRRSEHSNKSEKSPSRTSQIVGRSAVARTTVVRKPANVARTTISTSIDLGESAFTRTPDTQLPSVTQLSTETLPITPIANRFIPFHDDLTGMLVTEDDNYEALDYEDIPYHEYLAEDDTDEILGYEDIPLRQDRIRGLLGRKAFRMTVGVPLIAAIGILAGGSQAVQAEHQIKNVNTTVEVTPASAQASAVVDDVHMVALPNLSPTQSVITPPASETAPASTESSSSESGRPPVSSNPVSTYKSSIPTPEAAVAQPAPHSESASSAPTHTQAPVSVPKHKKKPPVESNNGYNGPAQGSGASNNKKTGHRVVHFVTGGATDDSSQMFLDTLRNTGNIPAGVEAVPTDSPKDMAPFAGGPLYTDQSVAITADVLEKNVNAVLAQDPNTQIVIDNFSEGNMGGNIVANKLEDRGIDVQVNAYGNPESAIGMQNKSSAANPIVKPVMDKLGIVEIPNVPGTVNIADSEDMWATTAGDGGLTTLGKFFKIPTNHRVVDTVHETPIQSFKIGSESYLIYGDPNKLVAVPPNATDVKGPDAPEFHKFRPDAVPNNIDVLAGQGGLPGPTVLPNPDPSLVTLPAVNVQLPVPDATAPSSPAPGSESSPTPSFFGEQPCFAPDGSQYFTPANAPC